MTLRGLLPKLPSTFERVHILGVDPGTTTGFAFMVGARPISSSGIQGWRCPWVPAFQEAGEWANHHEMWNWLSDWEAWTASPNTPLLVGAEAFIAGSNQRHGKGQKSLRDPLTMLQALQERMDVMVTAGREVSAVRRSASTVKRWASDQRLRKAWPYSLRHEVHGPHARDALRHGLYAAVTTGYGCDPFALPA